MLLQPSGPEYSFETEIRYDTAQDVAIRLFKLIQRPIESPYLCDLLSVFHHCNYKVIQNKVAYPVKRSTIISLWLNLLRETLHILATLVSSEALARDVRHWPSGYESGPMFWNSLPRNLRDPSHTAAVSERSLNISFLRVLVYTVHQRHLRRCAI